MSWYPGAIRIPGPPSRRRNGHHWRDGRFLAQANSVLGVVHHSAAGSRHGLAAVLQDPSRVAAWHFEDWVDGVIVQRYPLDAVLFTSGHLWAHENTIAVEHEGGGPGRVSEPLTPAQLAASVELTRWIAAQGGWTPSRDAPLRTLWEHREFQPTTACPSGRIPWDAYEEVEMGGNAWIVQPLDTLWAISRATGVPVADLAQWNGISDPSRILRGEVLRLSPSLRPAAAATAHDLHDLAEAEMRVKRVREKLEPE